MRSATLLSIVSLALLSTAVACAPSEESDNTDDQTQDVTGGSNAIESPVVFLFSDRAGAPKCAGALLSDTIAVTVKACAPTQGMTVGVAADKDGRGAARAQVKTIHTPPGADADIVVVELDKAIPGTHAVITHIPLRDGYAVNGVAAADERGFFSPLSANKGEASSITGKLISETDTHASIVPAKGSTICATDIGAPVCSSSGYKLFSWNITGTCGLSGLVVGPSDAVAAPAANAPAKATGDEAPAAAVTGCNANAWEVVELGRHADFLRQFAPNAFKPIVIDKPIIRNFPYAPDGLWGYKSKGEIKSCKIETAKLDAIALNGTAKVSAKVFFANMEERAKGFGRFGIAPKSAPTNVRWLPAKAATEQRGNNFELTFDGAVTADKDGEYIVSFRASANGGEAWTQCDTDGIANGYTAEKALPLTVGTPAPGAPTDPSSTTPQDAPANPSSPDYSDPASSPDESGSDLPSGSGDPSSEDAPADEKPAKKKGESSGCSAAPSGTTGSAGLPMLGALLGLAAFLRRRR